MAASNHPEFSLEIEQLEKTLAALDHKIKGIEQLGFGLMHNQELGMRAYSPYALASFSLKAQALDTFLVKYR